MLWMSPGLGHQTHTLQSNLLVQAGTREKKSALAWSTLFQWQIEKKDCRAKYQCMSQGVVSFILVSRYRGHGLSPL